MRRVTPAFLTVLVVLVAASSPAAAEHGDIGDARQDRHTGIVDLAATSGWLPVGSEGATDSSCTDSSVQVFIADDFVTPVTAAFHLVDIADGSTLQAFNFSAAFGQPPDTRFFSETGRWYGVFCDGALTFVPEGGPAITIPGLVQNAVDQLDPPDPDLAVTPWHGKHAVQLKSWLAVEPTYWNETRLATASAGRVQVTAWLDAAATIWDMGNGDIETCPNEPGTIWVAGMDEDEATCEYTYTQPSINPPNHTYDLVGTVAFDVGHTTNAPGTYGPFTQVLRSTTETIQVVEIQAVSS